MRFLRDPTIGEEVVNPGESKRVSFPYNPGLQTGIPMQIHARCFAGSEFDFTYWHPQWEEGNKATSWAPAPEDKQDTITGAGTTVTSSNLTANRALISNGSGKIGAASVTATELSYLSGATSNLQAQLDQTNSDLRPAVIQGMASTPILACQNGWVCSAPIPFPSPEKYDITISSITCTGGSTGIGVTTIEIHNDFNSFCILSNNTDVYYTVKTLVPNQCWDVIYSAALK